jgi:peptidoglycan-associated lipoprotein
MLRTGLLVALALAVAAAAGCTTRRIQENQVPTRIDDYTDTGLPVLAGEALVAADEITNARIYFEFDRFDIKPESRQVLARKAELLKRYPQIRVSIQGHCDARGTEEYNLALGERRARAAYEFLTMSGVNPNQLEMISKGKLEPAVMGSGDSAWALYRRDEFIVLNPRQR